MTRNRTILYAGTYERNYPRNQQLIRLLRLADSTVVEVHEPFWEHFRDKSRGLVGVLPAITPVLRLSLIYLKLVARIIPRLRSADALVIGYIGQLDMLTIGTLARLCRVPVIFNPLVTLTDTIIEDRRLLSDRSAIARIVKFLDWAALRIATAVITDTEENAEYLNFQFRISQRRIRVLPVGADEQLFQSMWHVRDRSDRVHVLFYGKMIPLHGIKSILGAIRILNNAGETGITFEIIGSGQQTLLVTEFLSAHPGAPVVYRPWVAYQRLPQRIASADCVLGIFGSGDKAGRVVPNKVYQALSVGAPVITRDSKAARDLLTHDKSAFLICPDDEEALASAIVRMRDPDLRARLGREGNGAFQRYASDGALTAGIFEVLDQVLTDRSDATTAGRCS